MKTKSKIIISVVIILVILIAFTLFWMYKNPIVEYSRAGNIENLSSVITTSTYLGMPMPKDIRDGIDDYQEKLSKQIDEYNTKYDTTNVEYKIEYADDKTILLFEGTGTTTDGKAEKVSDSVTLPYELYYREG